LPAAARFAFTPPGREADLIIAEGPVGAAARRAIVRETCIDFGLAGVRVNNPFVDGFLRDVDGWALSFDVDVPCLAAFDVLPPVFVGFFFAITLLTTALFYFTSAGLLKG
jgi:hypothetical protein